MLPEPLTGTLDSGILMIAAMNRPAIDKKAVDAQGHEVK
jgi:hypothetical protein